MTITLAITGGTGFAGQHLLEAALAAGHRLRVLTRQPHPAREGITWVPGNLANSRSLHTLAEGADAVIHLAGLTNAETYAAYKAANVRGTAVMRAAAPHLPFVHVSSLAARKPQLSFYGRSKRESEEEAGKGTGPLAIFRPPAIYGPGDHELLALFQAVRFRILPLPAGARASMLYADDFATALLAAAHDLLGPRQTDGQVFELDDGHGGYLQTEIARRIATILGVRIFPLPVPAVGIRLAASLATLFSKGKPPRLSRDRARYLTHRNWAADAHPFLSLRLWQPQVGLQEGLQRTIAAYRGKGWL